MASALCRGMAYVIQFEIIVNGLNRGRRRFRPFVREENAPNTLQHATRFDSWDAVEEAAARIGGYCAEKGHVVVSWQALEV